MEHIRSVGKLETDNLSRIQALENWVEEHKKVKSKHEWYLVGVTLLAVLSVVITLVK